MPRPKQRTDAMRGRVLASAMDLLERDGVAAFTARRVAGTAGTSTSSVYELFGDKGGLLRALYFDGFAQLRQCLGALDETGAAPAQLLELIRAYRSFITAHPILSDLMFSCPFTDFDPTASEREASGSVREYIVDVVRRGIAEGVVGGDATDVAHVLVALVQGMAAAENARRLGTTRESIDRRWELAIDACMSGLSALPRQLQPS